MTETIKLIQTNGNTIAIVEVPEGAEYITIDPQYPDRICFMEDDMQPDYRILPPGEWLLLGKSTELSEVQMKEICPYITRIYGGSYYDYREPVLDRYAYVGTVQERYLSLLQANGIVDRNPYGDTEPLRRYRLWKVAQKQVRSYLILSKK